MTHLPPEPIRLKSRRPRTEDADVEDVASLLIRRLAPPPSSDAAALARVAARLQTAIERPPRRLPRPTILLVAAAIVLVLSVAGAAWRTVTSTRTARNDTQQAPKNAVDEPTQSLSREVPVVPTPSDEEVERAIPLPMQNGSGSRRAHLENGVRRSAAEPAPDGPEVAEALWLGRALRKLRVEHDPNGALGLLNGYEAQFPARMLAAEVLLARVEAQMALGNRAEALRLIETERRSPAKESRQIVLIRGELRAGAGRCTDALADFDAILAQAGTDSITERALYGRAVCYRQMQQLSAAERDFGAYLRRFPNGKFASSARAAIAGP
jgi:hypothetical protein